MSRGNVDDTSSLLPVAVPSRQRCKHVYCWWGPIAALPQLPKQSVKWKADPLTHTNSPPPAKYSTHTAVSLYIISSKLYTTINPSHLEQWLSGSPTWVDPGPKVAGSNRGKTARTLRHSPKKHNQPIIESKVFSSRTNEVGCSFCFLALMVEYASLACKRSTWVYLFMASSATWRLVRTATSMPLLNETDKKGNVDRYRGKHCRPNTLLVFR